MLTGAVSALQLDINDPQSIKDAAATTSFNVRSNYTANHTGQIPGSNNAAVQQGNRSQWASNDDQLMWGLAAMTAAEMDFPADDDKPSWKTMAQNVFDAMAQRWEDDGDCGGGLR
ncbi:glycosyl hydrolase family 76-domain-containing protein [Aspergillus ambiguus]|uniref:glycosyl hydrolase family 76-domain-containing protein n=1 Tax=Aspergillus ambiguus TaxID=176160 RepID=UPI003CCDF240